MKELQCRSCKRPIYEGEKAFIPRKGFMPDLRVKRCYCNSCAERRHWKANYIATYKKETSDEGC